MRRLRRALDGTGPFSGLGIVLELVAVAMLAAILMSPTSWQWWMDVHSVAGHEQGGVVYYSVGGSQYTIPDPSSFADRPERTVYYIASDPADGSLGELSTQVVDWGLTVVPAAAGAVLVIVGFARRARRRANPVVRDYGGGIPSEVVQAILGRGESPPV